MKEDSCPATGADHNRPDITRQPYIHRYRTSSNVPYQISIYDWLSAQDDRVTGALMGLSAGILSITPVLLGTGTGFLSSPALSVAATLLCSTSFVFWKRAPLLCVAAALFSSLATDTPTLLPFASLTVGRHFRSHPYTVLTVMAVLYVSTRPLVETQPMGTHDYWTHIYLALLDTFFPGVVGRLFRYRRTIEDRQQEQGQRVRDTIEQAVRYAVMEDRTRVAFDIHDGVGHQLTVLTLQAGVLEARAEDPEAVRNGAASIRDASHNAMIELRAVMKGLNEVDLDGLDRLPRSGYKSFITMLARNMKHADIDMRYEIEGVPFDLPPVVERIVYRISQEALTNAFKHAAGAPIIVTTFFLPKRFEIRVWSGLPRERGPAIKSGGSGLSGLRRRLEEVDGCLEFGAVKDGFEIRASIPIFQPTHE